MVLFTPRGRHTERLRSGVVPAHLSPSHRGSDAVTTCGPFVSLVKAPPGRHVDDLAHQARTLTCLVPVLVAWCRVGGFRWIGGGGVGVGVVFVVVVVGFVGCWFFCFCGWVCFWVF